ncbi:WD40 repeat-like protein [Lentinula boryana]|uniref:WD40 repeat-like protein n=1 Tax=Lentinula boryana TaxID=40481 RepID=A0ABQ8Q9P7_9AGAR|nr:WD40 repeat-like protein [Lentinula boryana]
MATQNFPGAHHFEMYNPTFNHYNGSPPDIQQKLEQKLKPVTGTWLDKDKVCLEGTRTDIIEKISQWMSQNGSKPLLLCGEAGTGKSTISHTIGSKFELQLGAFFGFNRTFAAARTPSNALRTIAYRLGIKFAKIGTKLLAIIQANPNVLESTSILELWKTLIVDPAQVMADSEDGPRDKLLSLLFNRLHELPQGFHVLITSRSESDVIEYLQGQESLDTQAIQVQYMRNIQGTNDDIYKYVCSRMMKKTASGKLEEHQCKILAERAGEFFQWADIVCTFIRGQSKGGISVTKRFEHFMNLNKSSSKSLHVLDELYEFIFNDALDVHDEDAMTGYRLIMSQVLAAFEPLSQATLQRLQTEDDDRDTVSSVLSFLGSLFTGISNLDNTQVRPVHTSVLDFLLDEKRSKKFRVDLQQGHELLAKGSFHVMFRDLHFNMGNLESSYVMNSEIKDLETKLSNTLTPELIYACCWWDLHLQNIEPSDLWVHDLGEFFSGYSLYWMEVLGLMKKIHIASRTARHTMTFLDNLQKLMTDILVFIQVFGKVIITSTPHLYLSGMPFIPKSSKLHTVFEKCCNPQQRAVFSRQINDWPDQQVILKGHTQGIDAVAFSPDGKRIVSGSRDESIRIWNADTGEAIGDPLQGHSHGVSSVAFSPDGKRIVSGSWDSSIRIWNADTGEAIGDPLQGHSQRVNSVAFSPDGKRIVSGSGDRSIRIWDADTGEAIGDPLQGHSEEVNSVAFSPDGKRIVSGSQDMSIRIWHADTGEAIGDPLQGHSQGVNSVAFSPDGKRIVSGSGDRSIRIWDADTGEAIGDPLQGHSQGVNSVAFSPDGKRIVSGSWDRSIRIWNAYTGEAIGDPLQGHSQRNSHPYLISQYFPFHSCHIDDEGWLHGLHSDLGFSVIIIWIPPKFRPTLLFPPTHVIISQNGSCTLDLLNFACGKDWIQYSRSNVAPVFRE